MASRMGEFVPYSKINIERVVKREREEGNIIVLAGGTFDQYHDGHVYFLIECKKAGEKYLEGKMGESMEDLSEGVVLMVNVRNDKRVTNYKGLGRPVFAQNYRARMVSSLGMVDYTTVHPSVTESPTLALAKIVEPDLIVSGADDETFHENKRKRIRKELGYKVDFADIPRTDNLSSTSILEALAMFGPETMKKSTT